MPAKLRRYLKAKIKWLQENEPLADETDTLLYDAAEFCREARKRAVAEGLPDVAAVLARVRTPALALTAAQQVLAEALAAISTKPAGGPLTVKQAAEQFNISPRTLYRLCEDGKLRCSRVGSGRGTIRINPPDLERYLAASAQPAVSGSLYD